MPEATQQTEAPTGLDPALLAVIANRVDSIVREMTSTMLRAGRSAVINVARDFSCSIVTGDNELLSAAGGIPVHVIGSHLQTTEMRRLHPDLREGDAFLDNDPYVGNTHHADHTILVPVIVDGEHLFTAVAKAHQADIGNSIPTTYAALARDIYEEGAISFPCVQIQRDFRDVDDIIRMARRRIRVPDQWYGDYLAMLGSARTGERRLKELVDKYGKDLIRRFVAEWLDYGERRTAHAISQIPSGTYVGEGQYDSYAGFPAVRIRTVATVDAEAGRVTIDLRDNPDSVPNGVNLSRATSLNNAVTGLLNILDPDIPHNGGTFRRIEVLLRENCVVGIAQHPTCCSLATTNIADRLVNILQASFAQAGPELGLAEGGSGIGAGLAVVAGVDARDGSSFVNQLITGCNGGPGTPFCDGWVTWVVPVAAGMLYRDSIEVNEQKYPLRYDRVRLLTDGGGPGRHRGAPGLEVAFGPVGNACSAIYSGDCHETAPKGVHGGRSGVTQRMRKILADGSELALTATEQLMLEPGELLHGIDNGGGGFGDPLDREPERVVRDVAERWVSVEQARAAYGVVITGAAEDETLAVDAAATTALRDRLRTQATTEVTA